MRTQTLHDQWKWIIWLTILVLLNALALAAGSPRRAGSERSSSESKSASPQATKSAAPERTSQRSTPAAASSSSSRSASRTERRETAAPVTRSDSQVSSRSSSQSSGSRSAASSRPQTGTVTRSRPVNREVVVAPSSQSLNVSSPSVVSAAPRSSAERRTVSPTSVSTTRSSSAEVRTKSTPSITVNTGAKSSSQTQTRRDRIVEITGSQPGKPAESARSTITPIRQKSSNDKVQIASDTTKKQDITSSASSSRVTGRTDTAQRTGRSENAKERTVVRYKGEPSEKSKSEPVRIARDTEKQSKQDRPSDREGQRSNPDRSEKSRTRDVGDSAAVVAAKSPQRDADGLADSQRQQNRWDRLRSRIDERPRQTRPVGDDRIRDEHRGRVVVRDNDIRVERADRRDHHRPYIPRHLIGDIGHIRNDHHWRHHGSYFSFSWSNWSCGRIILAPYHDWYGISYYYPSYHRKYIFVSLGGYWPYRYRYHRYYWYGCHPYYWYGTYVVPQPTTVVYDYTTYNYYNSTPVVTTETTVASDVSEYAEVTDTPLPQSETDIRFADAVNAFEAGHYDRASDLFRETILMSPEDEILPFTYCQALFANGDYALAAYVLREAMVEMPVEEPAIYYPRGLYKDDQILYNQIASLESAIAVEPYCTDYQLLLGYQYLGMSQWDKAVNALEQASRNPLNANVVSKLLDIAEKMEKDAQETIIAPQS